MLQDNNDLLHYYCLMLLASLVFITFMVNKSQWAQHYSTLLLTPTCVGAIMALYLEVYDPITELQFTTIEHDYFMIVQHILLPFVLFQGLLVLNGDDLFGELGAITLFGIVGPVVAIFVMVLITQHIHVIDVSILALLVIGEVFSRIQDLNIFFIDFHIKVLIVGEAAISSLLPSMLMSNNFATSDVAIDLIYSVVLGYTISYLFGQMLSHKLDKSFCQFEIFSILFTPWITYVLSRALHINSVASLILCSFSFIKNVLPELSEAGRQLLYIYYGFMTNVAQTAFYVMFGIFIVYNQAKIMPYAAISLFIIIVHFAVRGLIITILAKLVNRICKDELFTSQSRNYMAFTAQYGLVGFTLCTKQNVYLFSCIIALNLWIVNMSRIYFLRKKEQYSFDGNPPSRILQKIRNLFNRFRSCDQDLANQNSSLNFVPLMKMAQQQ